MSRYQTRFESENIDTFIECIDFNTLSFEMHLHRHIEYHMVEEGEQRFVINGKEDVLYPGDFLIIFPYHHHSFPESQCFAHFGLVNLDILACYYGIFLNNYPQSPVIRASEMNDDIKNLVRYIYSINKINGTHIVTKSDYSHENDIERNTLHNALRTLIGEALKKIKLCSSEKNDKSLAGIDTTSAIIGYCRENYDKDISLSTVAKALYLNKDSVSRIFSKNIGISFNDFINELRVVKACSLLQIGKKALWILHLNADLKIRALSILPLKNLQK